jgi:hypothetical protein
MDAQDAPQVRSVELCGPEWVFSRAKIDLIEIQGAKV